MIRHMQGHRTKKFVSPNGVLSFSSYTLLFFSSGGWSVRARVVEVGGAVVTGRELFAGKSQDTERPSPVQVVEV